jgi:glycine/D-amino acid oxidase-like deaminating enzyme
MDLRGGQSVWQKLSAKPVIRGPLWEDVRCDVLVVGSGITGALLAFHLAEEGIETIVVDRRPLVAGSTPASTALLQYDIDVPLAKLRQRIGNRIADAAYRRSRQSLDDMQSLVARLGLDCDLTPRPSLYLARSLDDVRQLHQEFRARAGLGLEVEYLDEGTLTSRFEMSCPGAILSKVALELDPLKLTKALLLLAEQSGARLFAETTLTRLVYGKPTVCMTDQENTIQASHVVFATGYETPEEFSAVRKLCKLSSTFALATSPISSQYIWPERALIWDTGDPYLYARTAENRVIIGGQDETFVNPQKRDALIAEKATALLEEFTSIHDLGSPEIETMWSGTFASTEDGLPYIGVHPNYPGIYFALGYGGNGITFSLMAAQLLRDAIQGRENAAAALFSFQRHREKL